MWKIKYPSGNIHTVNLVFPLALCIVDMKGAHALTGMFDAYSNVHRPCVSCYCEDDDLDNPYTECVPVLDSTMRKEIDHKSVDDLKLISQHKITENAFFKLNIGGWKYGIWGLCPAEILHQYYEGLLSYTLEYFFGSVLTDKSRNNLNSGIQQVIFACKNQSDRSYPIATYSMGITHYARMKGTEKFSAIFYLALYFYTKESRRLFNKCQSSLSTASLQNWRKLFEKILFYRDWLMQETFFRSDVLEKKTLIIDLFVLFKRLVKRKDGAGLKLPKIHELLHSCRDILRHGPARGYDTCPTESNHRPMKHMSQNTQRIRNRFEEQTAKRLHEDIVIETAWKNSNLTSINKEKNLNSVSTTISKQNYLKSKCTKIGKFLMIRSMKSTKNGNKVRLVDSINGENIGRKNDFTDDLLSFLYKNVMYGIDDNIHSITCYSTYKRDGFIFYGLSRDQKAVRVNPSWAQFQWDSSDDTPGKCLLFVDLENVRYKDKKYEYEQELHVIIQSLNKTPIGTDENNIKIAEKCTLYKKPSFYCVSVNTIANSAFVIPDIGSDKKDDFIYVYPRDNWKNNF